MDDVRNELPGVPLLNECVVPIPEQSMACKVRLGVRDTIVGVVSDESVPVDTLEI